MAYSEEVRAEAMIALSINHFDYEKTAQQTGIIVRTLRNWEKQFPKKGVGDLLERAIERVLQNIPTNWDGKDWAVAVGILMDKWFLLKGMPTERTEGIEVQIKQLQEMKDPDFDVILREANRILEEAADRPAPSLVGAGSSNGAGTATEAEALEIYSATGTTPT